MSFFSRLAHRSLKPIQQAEDGVAGSVSSFTFVLMLFVPALLWIWYDRSVLPWDPSWYGEVSAGLAAARVHGFREWIHAMFTLLPNRTPGLVWLGQFFVPLGNGMPNPAFGLLLCTLLLQMAGTYILFLAILKLFRSTAIAIACAALISSAPLFLGMTETFFTEPFQGLGTALFVYYLAGADRRPVWRSVALLAIAALIATFGKITAGLYLVCPSVLFLWLAKGRWSEPKAHRVLRPQNVVLAGISFSLGALLAAWLYVNYHDLLAHAVSAAAGPTAELYGARPSFQKLPLWGKQFEQAFFIPAVRPWLLLLTVFCVISVATWRRQAISWADRVAVCAVAQVAFTLVAFSAATNEDSRFVFCLYPFVGVIIGWVLSRLNNQIALLGLGLLTAVQFAGSYGQAHGFNVLKGSYSPYLHAADVRGDNLAIIQTAIRATCTVNETNRVFAVGLDMPDFNANTLAFYASLDNSRGGKCYYVNLGVAEQRADVAWRNLEGRHPAAVLYRVSELAALSQSDPFNAVSREVYQRLRGSPGLTLTPVVGVPDLAIFKPRAATDWRILSAMFAANAFIRQDVAGSSFWHVHPSRRAGGEKTVVMHTAPLTGDGIFSADVERCDRQCRGVELEFDVSGTKHNSVFDVDLGAPVAGKKLVVPLHTMADDRITITVRSLDQSDNIDFCWLDLGHVKIDVPTQERAAVGQR